MSKISNKARVTQLKEWLETRNKRNTPGSRKPKPTFSKADYYKSKQ